MQKRSIRIAGHETSITLEPEFWTELNALANHRNISLTTLITEIDAKRRDNQNLSSTLRVYVLKNLKLGFYLKNEKKG